MRGLPNRKRAGYVLLSLVAVTAIIVLLQSGCGRTSAPAALLWGRSSEGHVYVARLLREHPLYEQYRRLDQEIASLRGPRSLPATSLVPLELGELFLPGPEAPQFPLAQFESRRDEWLTTLATERPDLPRPMDPDLIAQIDWARRQAQEQERRGLERAKSAEALRLADVRAAAVKERQEALNNAGLDLKLPDPDAEEAAKKVEQRLRAEIEAEVAAARVESNQRIREYQQQLQAETRQSVAAAEAEARARSARRQEIFVKSGSETRNRMSNAVTAPESLTLPQQLAWRPEQPPAPAGQLQATLPVLAQADRKLRLEQATRLAARRADLAVQLETAIMLAARRLAELRGIRVYFPPDEEAKGKDLTEEFRPELRHMFQP